MITAILTAVYLGILCSISPCPLATNIAAVSFVSRKSGQKKAVLLAGLLYTLGRLITFCVLGFLLAETMDAAPMVSHTLQKHMNMFLGPLLIITAMFLLGLLAIPNFSGINFNDNFRKYLGGCGLFSPLLLGIVFALSFCPTSAVLFFGTLLPLAIKTDAPLILSALFGFASGIPVVMFSFLIAFFNNKLSKIFNMTEKIEYWTTKITGSIFLLIGVYFTITQLIR